MKSKWVRSTLVAKFRVAGGRGGTYHAKIIALHDKGRAKEHGPSDSLLVLLQRLPDRQEAVGGVTLLGMVDELDDVGTVQVKLAQLTLGGDNFGDHVVSR